jgi:hypothetical protein
VVITHLVIEQPSACRIRQIEACGVSVKDQLIVDEDNAMATMFDRKLAAVGTFLPAAPIRRGHPTPYDDTEPLITSASEPCGCAGVTNHEMAYRVGHWVVCTSAVLHGLSLDITGLNHRDTHDV